MTWIDLATPDPRFPELFGTRANGKVAPDSSRSVDVD
jgi:hypothetical protein